MDSTYVLLSNRAPEHLPNRCVQRFPKNIPQAHLNPADGRIQSGAASPECAAIHALPEVGYPARIFANQVVLVALYGFGYHECFIAQALPNSRDALVCLHDDK